MTDYQPRSVSSGRLCVGIVVFSLVGTVSACHNDDVTATASPRRDVLASNASVVSPRSISFDLSTESQSSDARRNWTTKMNVRRETAADGRSRTTYLIDDPQRFAGTESNRRRLVRVEVDGNSDATAYFADGASRRLPIDPAAISNAIGALPALPPAVRSAIDNANALASRSAPVDGKMTGKWIDGLANTPELRNTALTALASNATEIRRGLLGTDVFVINNGTRSVEVEVDAKNSLVRNATLLQLGQVIARLHYDWVAAGNDSFVRSVAELTRVGNEKGGVIRSKISVSNITIDGQEVRP